MDTIYSIHLLHHHQWRALLVAPLVGFLLRLRLRLCLWLSLKVIDDAAPHTFDAVNVPLARVQVLIHVVKHFVRPL